MQHYALYLKGGGDKSKIRETKCLRPIGLIVEARALALTHAHLRMHSGVELAQRWHQQEALIRSQTENERKIRSPRALGHAN